MNDKPTPSLSSDYKAPDPHPSVDPGASGAREAKAPSMTLKQWEDSQPHYAFRRVPRSAIAYLYKDCIMGPPSWLLERERKSARIDWVRAFQEAKAAHAAAAAAADQKGGS